MSFFKRIFPWLYEEKSDSASLSIWKDRLRDASPDERRILASHRKTPPQALSLLARDEDADIRAVLTKRLAQLLPKLSDDEQNELYQVTVEAIRHLAEDQVTSVRVALASALKDIAKTPHPLARQLARDAERAVAEPIIRYSLSLPDDILLELIQDYPQSWQTSTIALRRRISERIGDAIIGTGNIEAGHALISNDGAILGTNTLTLIRGKSEYGESLKEREKWLRQIKRDWTTISDRALYTFLRSEAHLDKATTKDVLSHMHKNVTDQEVLKIKSPQELNEEEIKNALLVGEHETVIAALAARANIPLDVSRRMLVDSASAKSIVALCIRANMPLSFSVEAQKRLARVAPAKMLYPRDGNVPPMTTEEIRFQWEFFGLL